MKLCLAVAIDIAVSYQIRLQPSGLEYRANADEDLLSAAVGAGIAVPMACRNGVCEICEARLLAGTAVNTRNQNTIAVASRLMLCRTRALADVELEITSVIAAGSNPPRKVRAKVLDVRPLNHDVFRVELQLPRRRELSFHAGQYLAIHLDNAGPCYFSIASSPLQQTIELHIQASPGWASGQRIIDSLGVGGEVMVELPHGKACLAAMPHKPLLLIAAGTGFAQMKSLVEYLRSTDYNQPVVMFWGVRQRQDMYLLNLVEQWVREWPLFRFIPVVGDSNDNEWSGHHDQLVHAVMGAGADLSNVEVHASGSPAMAYALMDALKDAGLPADAFFSDVLEYAPRL